MVFPEPGDRRLLGGRRTAGSLPLVAYNIHRRWRTIGVEKDQQSDGPFLVLRFLFSSDDGPAVL